MEYRNLKTGAVINVSSKISGENWALVENEKKPTNKKPSPKKIPPKKVVTKKEPVKKVLAKKEPAKKNEITKAKIMQELDAFGIKYDSKSSKDELYQLMIEGG